eukprot:g45209.t1
MGEVLNEYFSSVFTVEKEMKTEELGEVSGNILGTVRITFEEVLEVLECMEVDKSPGPDQLGKWAEKWQMEFNIDKCEVLHLGKSNQGWSFMVNGRAIRSVAEQRHLGVQVHGSLKVDSQVDRTVKKAFGTLAFISQGTEYRSWEVMLQLYRML